MVFFGAQARKIPSAEICGRRHKMSVLRSVGVCWPGSSGEGSSGRAVSGHPNLPMPFFEPPGERLRERSGNIFFIPTFFSLPYLQLLSSVL